MNAEIKRAMREMRERQDEWACCECRHCKSADFFAQTECRRYVAFINAHEDVVRLDPTIRQRADAIGKRTVSK